MTAYAGECAIQTLDAARRAISGRLRRTPTIAWPTGDAVRWLGARSEIHVKLELLQHGGCFKSRGAYLHISDLPADVRARGVVAATAGNHGVSVAWAAAALGVSATVTLPRAASPARVARCRASGARVIVTDDIHEAFVRMHELVEAEGLHPVHSFDDPWMVRGAATVGLELLEDVPALDAVVVGVGGGALSGGIGAALAARRPECTVFGVEPTGANTMSESRRSGRPERLVRLATIVDSLGAPYASERTLELSRAYVREVVELDDAPIREATRMVFDELKMAVEPAAAAGLAALVGPLRERLSGRRVGLVFCGTNVEPGEFAAMLGDVRDGKNAPEGVGGGR